MKKHFGFSLFSVGIAAGLMPMLFMLMIMPSSTDGHEVFVMTMDEQLLEEHGDLLTIELKKGASAIYVTTLKQKIQQKIGISPLKQTLRSKNPYAIALKSDTVAKTFTCYLRQNLDLNLKFMFGMLKKPYTIVVNRKDTVAIVKNKIQHVIFIPYQTQTLTLRRNHGKALEENKTIDIPPGRQTLRLKHPYAKALEDDKTMEYYGIGKETTIFLGLDEFKIHLDFAWEKVGKKGNTYNVWVKRTDTVAILRKKINAVMSSYNYENYEFASPICPHLSGYTVEWDENVKTVEQCGIKKGHAFQVREKPTTSAAQGKRTAKKNKVPKNDDELSAPLL